MTDLGWLDDPFSFPVFGVGERVSAAVPIPRRHYLALGAIVAAIQERTSEPIVLQAYLSPEERVALLDLVVQAAADDEGAPDYLERVCLELRAGAPGAPFTTVAAEAQWWVDWASEAERKQYLLACFRSLPAAERVKFLAAAQRSVLA